MKWIKIDEDSYGTIFTSWVICAVLIFVAARYIPIIYKRSPVRHHAGFHGVHHLVLPRTKPQHPYRRR